MLPVESLMAAAITTAVSKQVVGFFAAQPPVMTEDSNSYVPGTRHEMQDPAVQRGRLLAVLALVTA